MSESPNIIPFPVKNRAGRRAMPPQNGMRLQLKDIIDTAYDGLLNDREAESLLRISELIIRYTKSDDVKPA